MISSIGVLAIGGKYVGIHIHKSKIVELGIHKAYQLKDCMLHFIWNSKSVRRESIILEWGLEFVVNEDRNEKGKHIHTHQNLS